MEYCILVVNPGSTSTKIAVFQGEKALLQKTIRHSGEELAPYAAIMDQAPFRLRCVEQALAGFDLTRLDAVCARGGMLPACPSGAFAVDQDMIGYLSAITQGAHASNLGCVMARDLAEPLHIPAYVYDPVAVDEMPPMARITGIPELPRRMMGHALNTRAMAIRCAEAVLHKPFDQCRLIVLHLGGGASVRLFIGGKMVDNVRDDELLFAPERSGGIAAEQLVKLCYSGKYDRGQMMKLVRGKSGLLAHLGTSDAMEVERRIAAGDEKARMVYDAMLYTAAKANDADVVIIDTAGRLHNKINLMNELTKIKNVMKKVIPDAPHEILLVLDGSTGQNAFEQAKQFTAATEVNALAVTKLDGTAKGGVVIGISDHFRIPVKYIGLGEGMEDLQVFRKREFVNSLFGE